MKKIFVLLAAMVMTLGANAKGFNDYNRVELGYSPMFATGGTMHGFEVAYARGFHLSQKYPMFIETGGRLAYRGATETNFLRLTVPVDFTWRFTVGRSGNFKISPYSGFTFNINLLYDVFDQNQFKDPYGGNRFQVGWEVGSKFNYKAFSWGIGFNVDFNPLVSYDSVWLGASNIYTSNLFISAGYEF